MRKLERIGDRRLLGFKKVKGKKKFWVRFFYGLLVFCFWYLGYFYEFL